MTQTDDLYEAYDADIPRVDLVKTSANGTSFLLMKSGDTLLDADEVRELVKEASPVPTPRDVFAKADQSTAAQNDLPDSDFAYIEPGGTKDDTGKTTPRSLRHFPIQDEAHVRNALSRAPQSPFGDKAMPKIKAAAKKFGIDVAKEAAVTVPELVEKAGDDPDDLDPTVVLAEPEDSVPGDPNDPGSPAWEAIDAATACKWTAILSRAKNALECLSDREAQEAVSVDPSDADNSFDMADAACAVDYAISLLAPFAVGEQVESDLAAEAIDEVLKAAAAINTADLDVIEGIGPFRKAGKVLSAANEAQIRAAVDSLQSVLSSLPQAEEAPVTKTAELVTPEAPAVEEDVAKAATEETVTKAASDPQMAVFDANGLLVGTIDPDDLSPIAAPEPPDGGDSQGADDDAAAAPAPDVMPDATPDADADPAAAETTPVTDDPDAATVIPGTDTVQSPPEDDSDTVEKSAEPSLVDMMTTALTAALKEQEPTEAVIKAALAPLEERLARVEAQPAPGGPLLNGSDGTSGLASRTPTVTDQVASLVKAAEEETDPVRKAEMKHAISLQLMKQAQSRPAPAASGTWEDVLARFK